MVLHSFFFVFVSTPLNLVHFSVKVDHSGGGGWRRLATGHERRRTVRPHAESLKGREWHLTHIGRRKWNKQWLLGTNSTEQHTHHMDKLNYEWITSSVMPSFLKLKSDSKSRAIQLKRPEHLWQKKEKGRKELERGNDIKWGKACIHLHHHLYTIIGNSVCRLQLKSANFYRVNHQVRTSLLLT